MCGSFTSIVLLGRNALLVPTVGALSIACGFRSGMLPKRVCGVSLDVTVLVFRLVRFDDLSSRHVCGAGREAKVSCQYSAA